MFNKKIMVDAVMVLSCIHRVYPWIRYSGDARAFEKFVMTLYLESPMY